MKPKRSTTAVDSPATRCAFRPLGARRWIHGLPPSLYGRDGEPSDLEIGQAVMKKPCISAEFRAFGAGGSHANSAAGLG